uniref:Choline transporter-like protein n=1 Tax=Schmidtea mediterranea TaxID=79327 RepID=A0A0H3YJH2_SCHMD|nr:slc44a-2 [Schmidtea mediterranea]
MSCISGKKSPNDYNYVGLENDKEREYDPNFKGPVEQRSCTDIICGIIFIVFISGLIFITFWAYLFGDFNKLAHPTNSMGELCGVSPSVQNQPKLVFFNLLVCVNMGPALMAFGCPTKQICVQKCPKSFWSIQFNTGRDNMVCDGGKNGTDPLYKDKALEYLVRSKICAEFVFPSLSVANRCVPNFSDLTKYFNNSFSGNSRNDSANILNTIKQNEKYVDITEVMAKLFIDFTKWYKVVSLLLGISVVVSLLYLIFLRYFAAFVVWITLILFVLIFVTGTVICFLTYYLIQQKHVANKYFSWYTLSNFLNDKFWLAMGIVLSIILIILILMLIFLRTRIRIAIAIMKTASKSLAYTMELIFWPIFLFIFQMIIFGGCILLCIQLSTIRNVQGVSTDVYNINFSSGDDMKNKMQSLLEKIPCIPGDNSTAQKMCTFIKYGTKTYVYIFSIYVLFMLFWLINFVKAIGQLTIAGTFASYYFAFNKPQDIPSCSVFWSLYRAIRYHLGSLAFGSLLLAIVQLIRWILQYLEQKAKESRNIIMEFILKCMKCCFWCLEKFIKFINKNAYIMIAIYGQNYCSAAQNVFNLLARNVIRVFVVDNVTDLVLFIGKLVIVGGFGVFSFVFFNGIILTQLAPKLFYNYVPVIVIIIGAYLIASIFMQIFELGTETIFLCFCEDLERNDGSPEKPYFMDKELMSILCKKNRTSMQSKGSKNSLQLEDNRVSMLSEESRKSSKTKSYVDSIIMQDKRESVQSRGDKVSVSSKDNRKSTQSNKNRISERISEMI